MPLTLDQAKAIYRAAIDPRARDLEGEAWWEAVRDDLQAVVAASRLAEASVVISWWHHDWSMVGDSAAAAVKRIRGAARAVLH